MEIVSGKLLCRDPKLVDFIRLFFFYDKLHMEVKR
jgi:hypothetical protein